LLQVVKNVNTSTGEVVSEKQKHIEDILTDEGYKVPTHKLGAKIFADVLFPQEMTDSEIGKMARLAKLMIATSNMLGYRARAGIRPYSEGQLIEIIGLSQKRGREFIEKMMRLGVIQKNIRKVGNIESEEFYINPAYFFAGRRISLNLYLLFREHLDPILPEWVRREFWQTANKQVKPIY
jgi:hypothetical protein